jgi:hypothetical protein
MDASEECIASIIRVKKISELRTMLAVISHICSFKMSVLTTATQCHIPEDGILNSHCHENLKSYTDLPFFEFLCGEMGFLPFHDGAFCT